jgi:hypothetical protein
MVLMNTALIVAQKAFSIAKKPLTCLEIIEIIKDDPIFTLKGKTPHSTIGACLYVDIKTNPKSIFCRVSRKPDKFYLKDNESIDDKVDKCEPSIGERRELIYAIRMYHNSSTGLYWEIVKIGHTKNIDATLSGYKRGVPDCELIGLWYANKEVKVTDCESGIHFIAHKCGYEHGQKSETFVFLDTQFKDFLSFVCLLLKRCPYD